MHSWRERADTGTADIGDDTAAGIEQAQCPATP
jgi:hypothetical protein